MMTLSPLIHSVYELSQDLLHKEYTVKGQRNLLSCSELDKMEIVQLLEIGCDFSHTGYTL